MKKIKYLLGIGILSTLFSTCFGVSSQSYRVIKDISNESFNGIFGLANNDGNGPYFYVLSGLNSLSFSFNSRSNGTSNINASNVYFDYGSLGFRIRGYGSSSGNIIFNNGFDSLKYTVDSIPYCLIYDSNSGGYLSFGGLTLDGVYSYNILFDGEVLYSFPVGGTYRCIYGVGNSFSVLHSSGSSSSGYNYDFYNIYFDSDGIYHIDSGYSVVPIYNSGNDFSGSGVYVISSDSTSSNLIFNYYDVFSSNPGIIKQGNLVNKGFSYSSLIPYDFIYGTFLSYSTVSYSSVTNLYFSYFCYLPNGEDMKCYTPLSSAQMSNSYYIPFSNIQFPIYRQGVFSFTSDSSAPVIDLPSVGGNGNRPTYSGTVSLNNCIDTQICWDYTGSQGNIIRMCTTECVSSGVIASGGYIGSDGTYYFVNSPISIEDSLKTDNPENMFTGSYIESGGILSLSYFTDYFQPGAKKVGICPFKYYEGPLDFMTKLKIGDVYLLMPVLCFYSAFQQGKNVSFFDQYNVNDGLFSQPMLYGESDNHKLLFAFFDVLFSIGLLGLIRYLSRHLF